MEIEKSPGYDWDVDYEDVDVEGGTQTMSIFGKMTIEEAVAEARFSLSSNFFKDPEFVEPAILAARRRK
jgi:hypothetical protein